MTEKKPLTEGYQPRRIPTKAPSGNKVRDGYQPTKSETKPAPAAPPKKP